MKQSPLLDKSFLFALSIVRFTQELQFSSKEYVLSKQVLRSGTAAGALLREAEFAASPADYINKFTVALKEANETEYWLLLIHRSGNMQAELFDSLHISCTEFIKMLISSINTLKKRHFKTKL
ncbi:MAG: four helix bundle protein [Bacteroidota bacterium]|nr:four helix bundle protein [Bacteroidota bacterium]